MLFVESQTLRHNLERSQRIQLLEQLEQSDFNPLIRSARQNCFRNVLLDSERISDLEKAIADSFEFENQRAYVRGDIFSFPDHVFFLIFDDESQPSPLIRAGIVYSANTSEPFRKLDSFCQRLRSLILERNGSETTESFHWVQG